MFLRKKVQSKNNSSIQLFERCDIYILVNDDTPTDISGKYFHIT